MFFERDIAIVVKVIPMIEFGIDPPVPAAEVITPRSGVDQSADVPTFPLTRGTPTKAGVNAVVLKIEPFPATHQPGLSVVVFGGVVTVKTPPAAYSGVGVAAAEIGIVGVFHFQNRRIPPPLFIIFALFLPIREGATVGSAAPI